MTEECRALNILDKFCVDRFPIIDTDDVDRAKKIFNGFPDELWQLLIRLKGGKFRVTIGMQVSDVSPSDPWYEYSFQDFSCSFGFHRRQHSNSLWHWFHCYESNKTTDIEFRDFFPSPPLPVIHCSEYDFVIHPESYEIYLTIFPFWDKPECVCASLSDLIRQTRVLREFIKPWYSKHDIELWLASGDDERILNLSDDELRACRFGDLQWTILHLAVVYSNWPLAEALIDRGFDPHETDAQENTLLHLATEHSSFDSVRNLSLKYPELIDLENAFGITALAQSFASWRHLEARFTKWLLYRGADAEKSKYGDVTIETIKSTRTGPSVFDESGNLIPNEDIIHYEKLKASNFKEQW